MLLIIYQQLNINKKINEITNHITLFYKITNYLSLNIELIFVFGKPPD